MAKLYAHWLTVNYRVSFGIIGASGMLFNYESPLRGIELVTRKITDAVGQITVGKNRTLKLRNIDAKLDWGYAEEYVEGRWHILQHHEPDTFVLATNRTTTVRDFVKMAFQVAGIEIKWQGFGASEVAYTTSLKRNVVRVNPEFHRPEEVDLLIRNAGKTTRLFGWEPVTSYEELCKTMVTADIKRAQLDIRV